LFVIRKRFGDGARAGNSSFGRPARRRPLKPVGEGRPPAWLAELDDHDAAEELSFDLYSDLGEVVEARTGVPTGRSSNG
jgi:hypothetical protein